ncbi:unnamed protein product [Coccothraustes coccothraustes]
MLQPPWRQQPAGSFALSPLCQGFSSLRRSVPEVGPLPRPPAAAAGGGSWGSHRDPARDPERCQQQESSAPFPLLLLSLQTAAWQASCPAFLGGRRDTEPQSLQ